MKFTITEADFTAQELKVIKAITDTGKKFIIQLVKDSIQNFVYNKYNEKINSEKVKNFDEQVVAVDDKLTPYVKPEEIIQE